MLYNLSRMRTLTCIVLLATLLPPNVSYAKAAGASAQSAGYSAKSLVAQNANAPQKPVRNDPAQTQPPPSIRISDFPPVSVTKDWSDRAYWLFTLFLVAVGALQVFLLWGNLRAIERQALQMERQTGILEKSVATAEKSAETARQNVELFVNRERGHLRVELLPLEWPAKPGPAKVEYKVTLYGGTEAYVTSSCARVEITDSPEPAEDAHWWPAMTIPQVITPDNRMQQAQVQGVFPKPVLEQADIEAIDAGRKFIHFRGFVKYNDVFGAERWTRCRRMWELSKLRNPDGTRSGHWSKRGSAKDNSET